MPGVCTAKELTPIDTSRKWDNGQIIRVKFLNGDSRLHSKVRQYAREWIRYANLDLEFVEDGPAEVRVTFNCGPGTSWSYIGTECLDIVTNQRRQTMNLDPRDLQTETGCRSVILHEFGHTLGLGHELYRADSQGIKWNRDFIHGFYWREQGWDKETVDAHLKSVRDAGHNARQSSAFDRRSIMVYPIPPDHARNISVDWNTSVSDMDKSVISKMYPGRWPRREDNCKVFVRQHSANDLVV